MDILSISYFYLDIFIHILHLFGYFFDHILLLFYQYPIPIWIIFIQILFLFGYFFQPYPTFIWKFFIHILFLFGYCFQPYPKFSWKFFIHILFLFGYFLSISYFYWILSSTISYFYLNIFFINKTNFFIHILVFWDILFYPYPIFIGYFFIHILFLLDPYSTFIWIFCFYPYSTFNWIFGLYPYSILIFKGIEFLPQTKIFWLKYLRSTALGCKDI